MMKQMVAGIVSWAMHCIALYAAPAEPVGVQSPDGKLRFECSISKADQYKLNYTVWYGQTQVVLLSVLGLNCKANWQDHLQIDSVQSTTVNANWKPVLGEQANIPDHYNEITVSLSAIDRSRKGVMQLIVRAYNEGIAFRYFFPEMLETQILEIKQEATSFHLPDQSTAFFTEKAQGRYMRQPLHDWKREAEMPLTISLQNGLWMSLLQAGQTNYSRMRLTTKADNYLAASLYGEVVETSPFATPWRIVLVAQTPGELLEHNYLVYNLNPACAIANTGWIKPGRVMREVTLSTAGAKKLVDFAVEQGLDYIHFDAGWYGYEYDITADATRANVDKRRNKTNALDLQEAIRYAKAHGKGVILYVNHRALEKQLDTLLPLYKSWGVAGIKFGFVHTGSHLWTRWLHEAIQKAAAYELMVDVHDEYYPTGFTRTYPNLVTQEGVLGNEAFPGATHNTILPFTRYLAGAGDYTPCFNHPKLTTTKCHQLALPVIFFSPWQYLYWYGRPDNYADRTEIEYWKQLPTTWDETKVIAGTPGEYAVIARRKAQEWYVGAITNTSARTIQLPLKFLTKGQAYRASIYSDGMDSVVAKKELQVQPSSAIQLDLPASGGAVLRIQMINRN